MGLPASMAYLVGELLRDVHVQIGSSVQGPSPLRWHQEMRCAAAAGQCLLAAALGRCCCPECGGLGLPSLCVRCSKFSFQAFAAFNNDTACLCHPADRRWLGHCPLHDTHLAPGECGCVWRPRGSFVMRAYHLWREWGFFSSKRSVELPCQGLEGWDPSSKHISIPALVRVLRRVHAQRGSLPPVERRPRRGRRRPKAAKIPQGDGARGGGTCRVSTPRRALASTAASATKNLMELCCNAAVVARPFTILNIGIRGGGAVNMPPCVLDIGCEHSVVSAAFVDYARLRGAVRKSRWDPPFCLRDNHGVMRYVVGSCVIAFYLGDEQTGEWHRYKEWFYIVQDGPLPMNGFRGPALSLGQRFLLRSGAFDCLERV